MVIVMGDPTSSTPIGTERADGAGAGSTSTAASAGPWRRRREALFAALPQGAAVVVGGGREVRRNSDVHHRFRQPSDLWFLTGFTEPESLAVLTPGKANAFTLLVRPRDPLRETWMGRRVGPEGARSRFGADQAFDIAEAERRLFELLDGCSEVHLHLGDDPELEALVLKVMARLRKGERNGHRAPLRIVDLTLTLHELRLRKDPEALACMRRAAELSVEAHALAMRACRAGRSEYEIEALIEYTFRRGNGHPGYGSIVGAGVNATILHYVDNRDPLRAGELLLVDAGCEFEGFTADITRTYPIPEPGKPARFSPLVRQLYEVVLAAQLAGIEAARPGATIEGIHDICTRRLTEGLVAIGLLSGDVDALIEKGEQKRYYLHRTSHFLGMDVHDVGRYFPDGAPRRLMPGMVITIEPGLYVAADDERAPAELRGAGIRIEDDILITESGHEVLTAALPKDPDTLEAIVGTGAILTV